MATALSPFNREAQARRSGAHMVQSLPPKRKAMSSRPSITQKKKKKKKPPKPVFPMLSSCRKESL
jgi:hypothetical protein